MDPRELKWEYDICRISPNIDIRLWSSDRQPDTYQCFLRWQDDKNTPRITLYRRYFKAYTLQGARIGAIRCIRRWMAKYKDIPDGMYRETWDMVREAFGFPPMPPPPRLICAENKPGRSSCPHTEAKQNFPAEKGKAEPMPETRIKIFIQDGQVESVMTSDPSVKIEAIYYNGSDADRGAYLELQEKAEHAGIYHRPFTVLHAYAAPDGKGGV